MLQQSGGTTTDAGGTVILFPATDGDKDVQSNPKGNSQAAKVAAPEKLNASLDSQNDLHTAGLRPTEAPQDLQPVVIPLHSISLTTNSISLPSPANFLQLPVRPGDRILVPVGGQVMVIGWVQAPGHFPVGSSLTVLEAVAAAGGPLYAGDQSDVQLIRTDTSGTKRIIPINLAAIRKGQAEDPLVFGNDVIDVPYSSAKIGPYVLYTMLSRIGMGVGFGGGIP